MTVTLAKTSDEYFEVNKKYTQVAELQNVSVVYPCDVLRPTFKIKGGYVNANAVTGVFGRNYWITGQTLNDGINYITCAVDAFSSWKNNIIGSSQFVNRSETHGNPYINDPEYANTSDSISQMYRGLEIVGSSLRFVIGVI